MSKAAVKRTPFDDAAEREIAMWPGVTFVRRVRSKHPALVLYFEGQERVVGYACTPSDSRRGQPKHIADVRAALKDMGAVRTQALRTAPKAHKTPAKQAIPPLRIVRDEPLRKDPSRDPWKALGAIRFPVAPTPLTILPLPPARVLRPWWARLFDRARSA